MDRQVFKQLLEWKKSKNRKPLILRGARQVGKTTLLKQFGKQEFSQTHYFNFEEDDSLANVFASDLKPKRILSELSFIRNQEINLKSDLVIFDEIQSCPRALTSLKYFYENCPELALCSAGSLLGLSLTPVSFPVGCVDFIELYPFSFIEFLKGTGDIQSVDFLSGYRWGDPIPEVVHHHLWKKLKHYFVVGGLPEAIQIYSRDQENLFTAFSNVRSVQKNLIKTYLSDMTKHSGKENSMHIERLWSHIPEQLAREQDGAVSRFRFKGVIPGIKAYSRLVGVIDWLEKAALLIKTKIVSHVENPLLSFTKENFFKLYLFDVGLLGAMSRLEPKLLLDFDFGSYKGYFAENFVAQEWRSFGEDELFCWKQKTAEIEFLKTQGAQIFPVEVKSGWNTRSRSLFSYDQRYFPPFKVILSGQNFSYHSTQKSYHCPLYLSYQVLNMLQLVT